MMLEGQPQEAILIGVVVAIGVGLLVAYAFGVLAPGSGTDESPGDADEGIEAVVRDEDDHDDDDE